MIFYQFLKLFKFIKYLRFLSKKIKVLRTDNGGEFCRNEFEELCKKCGIARHKTTPYTPQQNGVAERMNMTLMEKERSMLSGAKLGQLF